MRILIIPVERESFILLLILDSKLIPLTVRLIGQRRAPLFFIQSGPDDHMSHALTLVDQNRVGRSHISLMRDHHGKLIGALLDHPAFRNRFRKRTILPADQTDRSRYGKARRFFPFRVE